MIISLSLFTPENLVSRDGFDSPVSRQPAHFHTQAESGAYFRDSSRVPRRRLYINLNRHTPSVQSRVHRVTQLHRWRSLRRIHRHSASKLQGSSKWVLPWQVTMDQLICAHISHTHYWYEVVMLKESTQPNMTTEEIRKDRILCYRCRRTKKRKRLVVDVDISLKYLCISLGALLFNPGVLGVRQMVWMGRADYPWCRK